MTRRELLESDGPSQAPDAGLAAIAAGFEARAGGAGARAAAAAVASGAGGERAGRPRPLATAEDCWLVDLPPQATQAAGVIDPVDWGPPTGWAWRITGISVVLAAGTTLVQFYRSSAAGQAGPIFQTAASGLWEPAHLYLMNGARLVAQSAGGGVTLVPWGERIALHHLPAYLS